MKYGYVALPLLVLAGCEVLVQWHGWPFWASHFDPLAGPGLSVVMGILAAAFWWMAAAPGSIWKRLAPGALALAATAVLLAGPLYEVGAPLLAENQAAETRARQIERMETQLAAYRENSATRSGWLPAMQRAQAELAALEAEAAAAPLGWQTWAVVILQGLALLILQTGAAFMAGWASRIWHGGMVNNSIDLSIETRPGKMESESGCQITKTESTVERKLESEMEIGKPVATLESGMERQVESGNPAPGAALQSIPHLPRPDGRWTIFHLNQLKNALAERLESMASDGNPAPGRALAESLGIREADISLTRNFEKGKRPPSRRVVETLWAELIQGGGQFQNQVSSI